MATNTSDFFTYSATAGTAKNLQKPQDGGDNNQWGNFINVDLDEIVAAVNALSDKIADANEKTLVDFTATTDAVNHVGITNAAAGNGPTISAAGSESDVDLNVTAKGTGDINLTPGTNGDVNIPASKGITFGDDGEKIEGDGTDLTIASSATLNVNTGSSSGNDLKVNTSHLVVEGDSGNVGIGTSTPEKLTHLKSAQNANLKLENTDVGYSPQIILQGKTNSADNFLGQIIGNWDDDSSPVAKIVFESGDDTSNKDDGVISFWTSDASDTPDERMRIDNLGNLKFNSGFGSVGTVYGCRAWINFDGTSGSIGTGRANGNISAVTDNGTGDYTITFTTNMPDANYVITGMASRFNIVIMDATGFSGTDPTNSAFRIKTFASEFSASDGDFVNLAVFR